MAMGATMDIALTGMKTAQGQIDIVGRNIANVDTVGYTRKIAMQNTQVLDGHSGGVSLGNITRRVSEGLLKSFLASNSATGRLSAKAEYLNRTDILLGTPSGDNSIAANISSLQTAFNDFAADVSAASGRYTLMSTADSLCYRLNSLTKEIQTLRGDADIAIGSTVSEINNILDEISNLNDNIVKYTILGYDGVADLEDKRDSALRDLSGFIDISYFTRENGEIVIQTKEGVQLLDHEVHYLSHNSVAETSALTSYGSVGNGGGIGPIMVDGRDITNLIRDGELKGLIEVRDSTLVSLQSQLDELAGVLKDTINQIHNQGTAYPQTPYELEGSRTFIDTSAQQIKIEDGDVRFIIFGADGKEVSSATLGGTLGFTEGTIDDMVTALNDWLSSPTGANLPLAETYINSSGNLVIKTNDSNYTLSILDEAKSTPGSGQQDATIKFDANGDGSYDRTFSGFSNFFGLNDFFETLPGENVFDSKVMDKSANLGVNSMIELEFSDFSHGLGYDSIKIYPNDSLQTIVNRINSDPATKDNITATLVPNGNGVVLRLMSSSGEQIEICEKAPSTGFLDRIGLKPSNAGISGELSIRSEFKTSPGLIAAGSPEFNFSSGQYEMSSAVNNVAIKMADIFAQSQTFDQAGSISRTQTTIANYAATFVGMVASETNTSYAEFTYQAELTNSISTKEAEISGVDMDEELAQLIRFQQSYAACAKSFTASKEMLDMLLALIN